MRKKINVIVTAIMLVVIMMSIGIIGYAANGCIDFLVNGHVVYNTAYSDMFRPTKSGNGKLINDCNKVISYGVLRTGVAIVNSDGSVAAITYSASQGVTNSNSTADGIYGFELSASASYRAFLTPEYGLHLYMNRSTVRY